MCSTHGPARKRCSIDGCGKVAVQGGKCVSHGAKKKSCSVDSCPKQATLFGMCKRHYDAAKGTLSDNCEDDMEEPPSWLDSRQCLPISASTHKNEQAHQRGLSIFHDMSTVETILASAYSSADYPHVQTNASSTHPQSEGLKKEATHLSAEASDCTLNIKAVSV